ncbi:MAG: hypothetical protein FJW27_04955 [Acidimicrobiia bacterium]|nr:hypothetical protein [Acidimicrobiia bacterium]
MARSNAWRASRRFVGVVAATIILSNVSALAQQRPLVTEDPEPIGAGRVLIEAGIEVLRRQEYPVSGLEGRLARLPVIGVSVGISSIAELQLDMPLHDRLAIARRSPAPLANLVTATGTTTSDSGDLVIGTKVRLVAEGVGNPAVTLRVATKLPNASNESGLGLDTTDFLASAIVGKTVQSVRVVANGGLAILADPTVGNRQNDVLTYGLSLARAITNESEIVGEVNGRVSTRSGGPYPGTETRGVAALGARYTRGAIRFDGRILFGLHDVDPRIGVGVGFTYVFNAFSL